ncbi:hypothetical protein NI389_07405 [Pseudoalteromonas xiamenensis]|uniref:PssE/Cps14G family polysaccharide biosynthesis glycosyltransferase n=1 Tax=Pseudoalteromonas xiamenensis TaxID=882626 RepID=UPI0027E55E96|nr:PssE/Cps14G family polysaccharide biosynthesis glycosyltransferase [Pseudoalteromonas xiamenensis]WMN61200.1 hypothetical protein NI389_07405 [Pseudoalteromonas xiamenensis]
MNILVTVGSSSFDALVKAVDEASKSFQNYNFTFQIGNGRYKPSNGDYFSFTEGFSGILDNADLVITHAGAGTVFELLETGKKSIIVPNMDRIDKHQSDLAIYIEENNFAIVCKDIDSIAEQILEAENYHPKPYVKERFFLAEELVRIFSK